jgi:uncharacterized protein YbjT (DUF2867 family)
MSKTILITGASGSVSSAVLASLKGSKHRVRAMARSEQKGAALKATGVEVVIGDFDQPGTLDKAFEGVSTLWLLCTGPLSPLQNSNAIWAARQAGVGHVVRMSAVGAANNAPTINSRMHALSDAELVASGIPYTILKPHFFMQNIMMSAKSVATDGALVWAQGEGHLGMIDVRDIGDAAAKLLTSGGHEGKTYTVTGPQSLGMEQAAKLLGAALDKPVKYQSVSVEQTLAAMAKMGMDAFTLQVMHDYCVAYGNDWGDFVTTDFQALTGKAPRSFADFAKDFRAAFGAK